MIINFNKLEKLEKSFDSNAVSEETLLLMIETVLKFDDTSYILAPDNVKLALNTLKKLGILVEEKEEKKSSK